jgi:hypothetical protein
MSRWWRRLGLQARFMLIASVGVLGLALATLAVVGWFEYRAVEAKLRGFSENELRSLNALVESAMEQRIHDPDNVAIKVFNGWFEDRNRDYGPALTMRVRMVSPVERPLGVDDEIMRDGRQAEIVGQLGGEVDGSGGGRQHLDHDQRIGHRECGGRELVSAIHHRIGLPPSPRRNSAWPKPRRRLATTLAESGHAESRDRVRGSV